MQIKENEFPKLYKAMRLIAITHQGYPDEPSIFEMPDHLSGGVKYAEEYLDSVSDQMFVKLCVGDEKEVQTITSKSKPAETVDKFLSMWFDLL